MLKVRLRLESDAGSLTEDEESQNNEVNNDIKAG
jgi:hypothetical protein